ncbi:HAMP domain-containing sensor histidine kinase [Paenibacillus sp. FSL R7-0337]|uniref:HAMP domain-containing sensor histidine kinase n=1 Tax=unclassified Paenibacillus TaxID=185978 RepID=UPI00096F085D|nr:HAMP domain-containing sensor histidine kinase [Paenibacillus sp. FSL R7-0337]OMF88309.1 hypothetical protein BK147_27300 [Paenibacillus sp. FSL R7-0337]
MIYMLVFVLIAGLLSIITITGAGHIRNNMFLKYNDSYTLADIKNPAIVYNMKDFNTDYSYTDEQIIKLCSFLDSWSILIFFGLSTLAASFLFYHNKLKQPIGILREASTKISNNDLDFNIPHDSEDEMGQLCRSFESMRAALEDNNRQMWRSIEDRKQLNAAFSHDLRTPLTVLRGYADFLNRYLPEDKISKEKLLDTITTMSVHILRLENYVQIMGEAQKLDEISVALTKVEISAFLEQLSSMAAFLAREHSLELSFDNQISEQALCMDTGIVTRIYENMIANSLRYASQKISVRFEFVKGFFSITVSDDGDGFSNQDLKRATTPFYTNGAEADQRHYGMGLNICKVLAEKLGGNIQLTNNNSGGACVKVWISVQQS